MPQTLNETKTVPIVVAEGELVPSTDPRSAIISINRHRMSGAPCFVGTRVPIKHLWDYLEGGDSLNEFLEDFEGVSREQAIAVLQLAWQRLLEGLPLSTMRILLDHCVPKRLR
ncbi:MAG: DUF433 domain-containing protein, partial [Abditibacteriales bacterium]|nr:DUF433 domain-containing protein [Abditibacteriales bacterium]